MKVGDSIGGLYQVELHNGEKHKLKTCPFCGGEACLQEHVFHGYTSTFGVVCLDCCCETRQFYNTEQEAAEAWNRRVQ